MPGPERKPRAFRVCLVAPVPPPYGGMSLQADRLAQRLADEGIAVLFLATNPRPPRGLRFVQSVPGLRTIVRELQYLTRLLGALPRARVFHHFAASEAYFFLHSAPLLVLGKLCKRKVVLNYRGGNAERFLRRWRWLVVPLLRLAEPVAVPSEFLRRSFRNYGLQTSILPNVVETRVFTYRERRQCAPRLLATRNLEPMYNVECVLRAFRIVQDRFTDAVLGVLGSGSAEAKLRRLAEELGLNGVTFYGAVPPELLPEIYARYDIWVNASNVDNFPAAVVEAACCGLPIVTTRAGGIPDMIGHRETGLLVELDDHQALAAGVLELLADSELAQRLARAARQWVEQFSWEATFASLLSHYGFAAAAESTESGAVFAVRERA